MITLYRSNYNEFNPDENGGDITDIKIESGVLHSFIPRVRPRMAEIGGQRWFKFFIKTDEDIKTIGVDIAKYSASEDEEVYFTTSSSKTEVESDIDKDNASWYGGFLVTNVDKDNLQITADRDVSVFAWEWSNITFYDENQNRITSMIVDSVDTDKITFKEWSNMTILKDMTACSSITIDSLDKDDYIGIWIIQTINSYANPMENPADSFVANIWYDKK